MLEVELDKVYDFQKTKVILFVFVQCCSSELFSASTRLMEFHRHLAPLPCSLQFYNPLAFSGIVDSGTQEPHLLHGSRH